MKQTIKLLLASSITTLMSGLLMVAHAHSETKPYQFEGPNQQMVAAEIGSFKVPENRNQKDSRQIELKYVKFPTTSKNPGNPIIYLAGGPGGSATDTAKSRRFPLFLKLRDVADVILFDQRGTGLSNDLPECKTEAIDISQPTLEKSLWQSVNADLKHCISQWQAGDFDLSGYNTLESSHDLVDLAKALGTEKIDLWGISYGTHLAFAAAKYHPEVIGKMVLASSEGLGQTIKRPSRVQGLIERVETMIDSNPETQKRYPHLIDVMRRVLDRIKANPVVVDTQDFRTKQPIKVGIGKMDIQFVLSYVLLRDADYLVKMPRLFKQMDEGNFAEIGAYVAYIKSMGNIYRPMSMAMDAASGVSESRFAMIQKEAETALVGRTTNFPFPDVSHLVPVKDLGDEFRGTFSSNIPTLFLAGTLDGRTPYESQKENAENFSKGHFVSVEGAGHNLFMLSPKIGELIEAFLKGEKVTTDKISLAPLVFE